MRIISKIAIDLAKTWFHIFAADEHGKPIHQKKLHRSKLLEYLANAPKSTVFMEACSSSHYWGQKISQLGHEVKLINPAFVKPFVKGNKNDFNDAEAICEAGLRPTMRFVPLKSIEQQDLLAIHRVREQVVQQRTQLCNQMRSLLAERGLVTGQGVANLRKLVVEVLSTPDAVTITFRELLREMNERFIELEQRKKHYDQKLKQLCRQYEPCRRLLAIHGIGPICATALYATVGLGHDFKNGRECAAWIGLVPRQETTGGKPKLLGISKRGDRYLRKQLIHGARAAIRTSHSIPARQQHWLAKLKQRKHPNVVAVAFANKMARIAWALLATGEEYHEAKAG